MLSYTRKQDAGISYQRLIPHLIESLAIQSHPFIGKQGSFFRKADFATSPINHHGALKAGLYIYGYRWYDSQIGRWINRDPIGHEGGLNIHAMTSNDLLNRADYLGLFWPPGNQPYPVPNLRPMPLPSECIPCPDGAKTRPIPSTDKCISQYRSKLDRGMPKISNNTCDGVPDSFLGLVNFNPACDAHDKCYSTCGNSQLSCDMKLTADMGAACSKLKFLPSLYISCIAMADAYGGGLTLIGGPSYESAQDYHCEWFPCCP